MPRFHEDKYREEVLAEFLATELYPRIATEFEQVSSASDQKAGHDARIQFDWRSETVVADEKAQNSDRWLNDPAPTFVMEIYGESWIRNGEVDGNIGWFVDPENETEYYVLGWLPDVSLFKLASGTQGHPFCTYQPADGVEFDVEALQAATQQRVREVPDKTPATYRMELTPELVETFEETVEPMPDVLTNDDAVDYGEWYYDPENIHEAKFAIVQKEKVQEALAEDGLTRDVLVSKGRRAVKEGTVDVESRKAKCVMRSSGAGSGSADDEDPVILVVYYDTYHEIADKTVHYREGSWEEDTRLF